MSKQPIFYSFRRCPYAMRARLAVAVSETNCELREVLLRDKPAEMLAVSPKATVPVLVKPDGAVLEESLDIMLWALENNDPEHWLEPTTGSRDEMMSLIEEADSEFKDNLDRYKYAPRGKQLDADGQQTIETHQQAAMVFIKKLEERLAENTYLFGDRPTLADNAIAPFVRQFANVDFQWFSSQPVPNVQTWLKEFVDSPRFNSIMGKNDQWESGTTGICFPM